jgi:Transglycosylase-like domain
MEEAFSPTEEDRQARRRERPQPRPDRYAFWAVVMAVIAMLAGLATADAGAADGGIGTGGGGGGGGAKSGGGGDSANKGGARYSNIWDDYSQRNKRWARQTSECESGRDPNAIGGGGKYRGAFQFLRSTWRHSPKTPGGDPIDYNWKTQAVVAVALKKRDGRGHWPVCG